MENTNKTKSGLALILFGILVTPCFAGLGLPPEPELGEEQAKGRQWTFSATEQDPPPCSSPTPELHRIRGLLVGIDNYASPKIPRLDGAAHDANLLRQTLMTSGAHADDVTVLLDEAATQANWGQTLDNLVASTRCGDVVFLSFSGASPTWSVSTDDRFQLYCHDCSPDWKGDSGKVPLTAQPLRRVVNAIRNRGAFAFVLLDGCHTANGDLDSERDSASTNWRWSPLQIHGPSDHLLPGAGGYAGFFIEGAEFESVTKSGVFGFLSFSFATALLANPSATVRELARAVFADAPGEKGRWTPVFEASDPNSTPFSQNKPRRQANGAGIEITQPKPTRGVIVSEGRAVHVEGRVLPGQNLDAVVIANRKASLDEEGAFSADLDLEAGRQNLDVVALFKDQSSAAATFAIEVAPKSTDTGSGKRYALVIGNKAYVNGWKPLETPLHDAEDVARVLHDRFGFELELPARGSGDKAFPLVIKNATKLQMQRALFELERVGPDDTVLVYYAGHGHRDPAIDFSYWIPVDADSEFTGQWLPAEEINGYLAKMNARHVLVVSDSCFSGTMAMRDSTPVKPVDPTDREQHQRYLAEMLRRRSRNLLSSGADEPVADAGGHGHSVFAEAFLKELETSEDDQFTANELYTRLRPRVVGSSKQAPQFIYLGKSGGEGGDLVFFRKK